MSSEVSTVEDAKLVRNGLTDDGLLPHPDAVRGQCPVCGNVLVSQMYQTARGFLLIWHCWASMGTEPACDYRKVM